LKIFRQIFHNFFQQSPGTAKNFPGAWQVSHVMVQPGAVAGWWRPVWLEWERDARVPPNDRGDTWGHIEGHFRDLFLV
jgi:hypothetical protein